MRSIEVRTAKGRAWIQTAEFTLITTPATETGKKPVIELALKNPGSIEQGVTSSRGSRE